MIRRFAVLPAALLLTLTACGGGDESTGDEVADARPAYANQEGREGAEKFAGYWVDEINEATSTGETEQLRSLGLDSCGACTDFPNQLDQIYDAGGRVESEDWELDQVVPESGSDEERVGMLLTVKVPPQKVYATDDAKAQEFAGGDQRFRMIVERVDEHWMIKDLSPR